MISGLSNINITPFSIFLITKPFKYVITVIFTLLSIIFSYFSCIIIHFHFKRSRAKQTNRRETTTIENKITITMKKGKIVVDSCVPAFDGRGYI